MSSSIFEARVQLALGAAAFALLTACSGGGANTAPVAPPVTPQQNAAAAAPLALQNAGMNASSSVAASHVSVNDAAAESASHSLHDALASIGVDSGARNTKGAAAPGPAASATPCITASPLPVIVNADGIPKNETYTVSGCSQQWAGNRTATYNGQFTIMDNTVAGGPLTWTRTVTNMNVAITGPDNYNATDLRNGTAVDTLNSATELADVRNFTNQWNQGTPKAYTGTNNLNVVFDSASGATIVPLKPLPSGTVNVTGTHQVATGTQTATYNVTTATPLTYDSTCQYLPRITAGQIVLTPATASLKTILVTWNGCGNLPTVTPQ